MKEFFANKWVRIGLCLLIAAGVILLGFKVYDVIKTAIDNAKPAADAAKTATETAAAILCK